MDKFKIGDKVRVVACTDPDYYPNEELMGKVGIIAALDSDGIPGIEFEEHIDGHYLNGRIDSERGWYLPQYDLEEVL